MARPIAKSTMVKDAAVVDNVALGAATRGGAAGARLDLSSALSMAIFKDLDSDQDPGTVGAQIQARMGASIKAWLDLSESGVLKWSHSESVAMEREIGPRERGVIHGALRQFPWEDVALELDERLENGGSNWAVRAHVLSVLGGLTPRSEFDRLRVAASGQGRAPRTLQGAFQASALAFFARYPREAASLRERMLSLPHDMIPALLAAAVERGDHFGLKGLAGALGAIAEADPLVALSVGHIAAACPKPAPDEAVIPVRRTLSSSDGNVRVEGAKALGKLDDVGALAALIECLRDPELRVRRAAHAALEALSKERHPPSYEVWAGWHRGAKAWRVDRLPVLLSEMKTGETERVSRALLELARYRVYRHVIVEGVIDCSRTANAHVGVVAASALGHFGTTAGAIQLVELMGHPALKVKQAAYAGLRRITGEDHGEDIEAWRLAAAGKAK